MVKLKKSKIEWGYVYIIRGYQIKGSGGSIYYYVGCTRRPLRIRMKEHFRGESRYTSKLKNMVLECYFMVPVDNIFSVERYLKDHRQIVYSFVNKEYKGNKRHNFKKPKLEKKFFKWCDEIGIPIIESGKICVQIQKVKKYDEIKK